jgi:hypothetical protein
VLPGSATLLAGGGMQQQGAGCWAAGHPRPTQWWVAGCVGLGREGKPGLYMCCATTGHHCSIYRVQHRELMSLTYYACMLPGTEVDCSLGGSGQPITGDINRIKQYNYQSHAQYVLVVEKDAIFQVRGSLDPAKLTPSPHANAHTFASI